MYIMETDNRILLKLERGEPVIHTIENFAATRQIPNAMVFGIGAVDNVEIGAYDLASRTYTRKQFDGAYELTNLTGNIGYKETTPVFHAHVTLSDHDCRAYGGHLFEMSVYATVELVLWPGNNRLRRTMDDDIGLALWNLPHCVTESEF